MVVVKILLFVGALILFLNFASAAVTQFGWIPVLIVMGLLIWVGIDSLNPKYAERRKEREDRLSFERNRKDRQAAQVKFEASARKYTKDKRG